MSRINFQHHVKSLRAYKEKTGHLRVSIKDDRSLYNFCRGMRQSRRDIIAGKKRSSYSLNIDRIADLDAIGFDWQSHNTRTKKSNPIVPNSQLAQALTSTRTLPSENPSHSTNYPSLYPMQQQSTTYCAPVNSHVASVAATKAATKEIVDLYNSRTVMKAKLKLAECERKEAELKLSIAKIDAEMKDKKVPTKKRAGDNCSDGREVKVKIEEEFWY